MPPKAKTSTSASPDVTFLYECYEHSDHKKINFRAVADEHNTTVGAANKRFSRIKSTSTTSPAFMYSCLKHSGYQKINWNTLGTTLNTTSGAVSKRFSRLKAKLEVSDQAATAGEEQDPSPTLKPQKVTKRKRNGSSQDEEEVADPAGTMSEKEKKPAPKARKTRKTRPALTVNVSQDEGDVPMASDSAGRQLQREIQSTVEVDPAQRSETLTSSAEAESVIPHTTASINPELSASTFPLPNDVNHMLGMAPVEPIQPGLAIPVADRDRSFDPKVSRTPVSHRSEYRNLLDRFEATSRPGGLTPSPRRSHSPYTLSSSYLDSPASAFDHTPAYRKSTYEHSSSLNAEETIWQAIPYQLNPMSSTSSYSQNFFDHRAAYQALAAGNHLDDEEDMYGE